MADPTPESITTPTPITAAPLVPLTMIAEELHRHARQAVVDFLFGELAQVRPSPDEVAQARAGAPADDLDGAAEQAAEQAAQPRGATRPFVGRSLAPAGFKFHTSSRPAR